MELRLNPDLLPEDLRVRRSACFTVEGVVILFVQDTDTDPLRWNKDQLKSFLRHRLTLSSDSIKYDALMDTGVNAEVLFISSVDRLVQLGFELPHAILIENTSGAVKIFFRIILGSEWLTCFCNQTVKRRRREGKIVNSFCSIQRLFLHIA
jgi:hypothetical protein